jgi:hypothetical protein
MTRKQSTFLNNKYWLNQNIDRDFDFDVWGVKETKQKTQNEKKMVCLSTKEPPLRFFSSIIEFG